MSTPTRDRIVDAAMRLFSERGFRGTTITAIEEAAGLSPGAGSIYHHFKSKQALLESGIDRQLQRLQSLREIRRILGDLGDFRAELTVYARYVLVELDSETELLRILPTASRHHPELCSRAVDAVVTASHIEFADWLAARAHPAPTPERAAEIASFGYGALLSSRLTGAMLGDVGLPADDEALVRTWVAAIMALLAEEVSIR